MSANLLVPATEESHFKNPPLEHLHYSSNTVLGLSSEKWNKGSLVAISVVEEPLSPWSESRAKRVFDSVSVFVMLPVLVPIALVVGLATRLTSRGPVLFMQERIGRNGSRFTIIKFRTMEHAGNGAHKAVTTVENQKFTPVGPFLRRWKLDELPQLLNVLKGEMSLVGPRPKLPNHQVGRLHCRPGITGAATITFAREEEILARLPEHLLDSYYQEIVLPAKFKLDSEYMRRATFYSDLRLLVNTVLRRWDSNLMRRLLDVETVSARKEPKSQPRPSSTKSSPSRVTRVVDESLVATSD